MEIQEGAAGEFSAAELERMAAQDRARASFRTRQIRKSKHARDRGVWGYATPRKNGRRK